MEAAVLLWFHLLLSVIFCNGFHAQGPSDPLTVQLGDSVMLPCFVETPLPMEDLEVEWKRNDSGSLVHFWQNGESRPESQNQRYHERAHFFSEEVAHGNFSLLLTNVAQEDAGVYKCVVHTNQNSDETLIEIEIERLIVSGGHIISAYAGEEITLNCSVDSHIPSEKIEEVSWKKQDEDLLLLLYQEGEILTESTHGRFKGRVEFFSAEDRNKGNFSMRLKDVRIEDKGLYICSAISGTLSDNTTVEVQQLGFSSVHIGIIVLCLLGFVFGSVILGYLSYTSFQKERFYYRNKKAPRGVYRLLSILRSSEFLFVPFFTFTLYDAVKVEERDALICVTVFLFISSVMNYSLFTTLYHSSAVWSVVVFLIGSVLVVFVNAAALLVELILKAQRLIVSGGHIISAYVGEEITLNCSVDSHIPSEKIEEVSWKKQDEDLLLLLYQEGEILTESTHGRFKGRVEFFSAEDRNKGNFSMRLKDVRIEDKGLYICSAFSGTLTDNTTVEVQVLGFSSVHIWNLVLCITGFVIGSVILGYFSYTSFKRKDKSRRVIQCAHVLCPNITLFIGFILWGFTEATMASAQREGKCHRNAGSVAQGCSVLFPCNLETFPIRELRAASECFGNEVSIHATLTRPCLVCEYLNTRMKDRGAWSGSEVKIIKPDKGQRGGPVSQMSWSETPGDQALEAATLRVDRHLVMYDLLMERALEWRIVSTTSAERPAATNSAPSGATATASTAPGACKRRSLLGGISPGGPLRRDTRAANHGLPGHRGSTRRRQAPSCELSPELPKAARSGVMGLGRLGERRFPWDDRRMSHASLYKGRDRRPTLVVDIRDHRSIVRMDQHMVAPHFLGGSVLTLKTPLSPTSLCAMRDVVRFTDLGRSDHS
ncbi:junctional adhesion molecule-like isoform X2 [Silurus asotus]|uniref:Junctional adhesion molecule-like isoform X2 n=1 Tax=Silurus asotus TaxID=30991 RepID=A0AAD5AMS5_SILAS|nr:junctional adhesion molecule-like isoform X2 [Silurus asotus]